MTCRHCSVPQLVTLYKGYTDAVIQNMYVMFGVYIDSVVLCDGLASPGLSTLNSVSYMEHPAHLHVRTC